MVVVCEQVFILKTATFRWEGEPEKTFELRVELSAPSRDTVGSQWSSWAWARVGLQLAFVWHVWEFYSSDYR